MAITSSRSRQFIQAVLAAFGLTRSFAVGVSGDDVRRGKPDPEIFRRVAWGLGVDPRTCVAWEDSAAGIEPAAAAGMLAIAVPNRYTAGSGFSHAHVGVPDLPSAYTRIKEERVVQSRCR